MWETGALVIEYNYHNSLYMKTFVCLYKLTTIIFSVAKFQGIHSTVSTWSANDRNHVKEYKWIEM